MATVTEPVSRSGLSALATKWRNFRKQGGRQQVRTFFVRVWPLSVVTKGYYRARYWEPIWYNVINRGAGAELRRNPPRLDNRLAPLADTIKRDGICVVPLNDLLGAEAFAVASKRGEELLQSEEMMQQEKAGKSKFGQKNYVMRLRPPLSLKDGLTSLAVNDKLLALVNAYLGVSARLKSLEFWKNLPVDPATPEIASMRWHRDYDDHKIIKVFLYMGDVDKEMGPFTFMRGSQPGGRYGDLYPSQPPNGSVPPKGAVEQMIPAEQRLECTGTAGTLVICDATGFHKGGRSTTKPRILFTITYATNGAIDPDAYSLDPTNDYSSLSPAARYALRMA